MNTKSAVDINRKDRKEPRDNGDGSQPGAIAPPPRLPLMKTFEDAAALSEKVSADPQADEDTVSPLGNTGRSSRRSVKVSEKIEKSLIMTVTEVSDRSRRKWWSARGAITSLWTLERRIAAAVRLPATRIYGLTLALLPD